MGNSASSSSREGSEAAEPDRDRMRQSMPVPPTSRRVSSAPAMRSTSVSMDRSLEAGGIEQGPRAAENAANQLGYWYLIKKGYSELVNLIIRPPRAQYEQRDLGPVTFTCGDREFKRVDFTVVNDRQQTLQCSHWLPAAAEINGMTEFPCVIYLHGNSSCRLEALSVLRTCLSSGMTVVAFDCAGCGKSDGEYISLGYYERDDLQAVINHLRASSHVSTLGLWGRSMGAATALMHADRDPSIAGIVVDSGFTNLEQLVQEIVEHGRREGYTIPGFLVKIVLKFIRSSVQKRANFDIKDLSPIEHASISYVPALFVAANGDDFIAPHHSDQLYAQYAGDKNVVKVDGDHNSARPQFLLDSVGIFLQTALQVDPRLVPESGAAANMRRMPWTDSSHSLMLMDLDAAISGKESMSVPKAPWACPSCTFVNRPLLIQVSHSVNQTTSTHWKPK